MKRILKQTLLAVLAVALAIIGLAPTASAAGTATLSFSPSSGSVIEGKTLTIGVYENSGTDTVNAVQANFSYPDTLLDCTSVANSSSFTVAPQSDCSGGSVKIGRGAYTAVSGSKLVATVYFKALKSSGTAGLDFDSSSSKVVRSTDHQSETLTVQNSSYTLSAAAVPKSGGSSGSGGATSSGTTSSGSTGSSGSGGTSTNKTSSSTSTKKTAPPKLTITSVTVSDLTSDSATVSWKTSVPASSEVDYGPNSTYGLSVVSKQLTTSHSLKLNSKDLRSSLVYHFMVKSTDASGQTAASPDRTFETAADGSVAGQSSDQTKTYLVIAVAAIVVIGVIAAAAAWYIHRMHHAAALLDAHVMPGAPSTPTILPPSGGTGMITPQNPPQNPPPAANGNRPDGTKPPGAGA